MPELASLLDETLEAWRYAREGVIAEAENIPADHWGFRPTPENRDVAELVRHIIEAGLMAVGELGRPDGDFTRQGYPEHIREHAGELPDRADRDSWLHLLRQTLDEGTDRLREAGVSAAGSSRSGSPDSSVNASRARSARRR